MFLLTAECQKAVSYSVGALAVHFWSDMSLFLFLREAEWRWQFVYWP